LPVIVSSKLSGANGTTVTLHPPEFPAGATLSGMLDVKNISEASTLELSCAAGNWLGSRLAIGGETSSWSLQQISPDQLFFSYDTSAIPAGCDLEGRIDNGKDGRSKAFLLARLIRIPKIDTIAFASESQSTPSPGLSGFYIEGRNLEMIGKAAWDSTPPTDVTALPTPIMGEGQRQRLPISLPQPGETSASLTVWLRGDAEGRPTSIKYENPVAPAH
jgi:hypothetical protein